MDDQKRTLMAKDLAESFHRASEGDEAEENKATAAMAPQGFLGNILGGSFATSLWQQVSIKLVAIIEEVVREQLDAFLVRHGGATGGAYVVNPTSKPDEPKS